MRGREWGVGMLHGAEIEGCDRCRAMRSLAYVEYIIYRIMMTPQRPSVRQIRRIRVRVPIPIASKQAAVDWIDGRWRRGDEIRIRYL